MKTLLCVLCAFVVNSLQESTANLVTKVGDADEKVSKDAGDALVKKGTSAKSAVQKALDKADAEKKPRYEEVLLRIDAGTDLAVADFGTSFRFEFREGAAVQELDPHPTIKVGIRLKAVFEGINAGNAAVSLTLTKGFVVAPKGRFDLIVKGGKGELFSRTFDPEAPKMFEYGAIVPPRYPPGTRILLVFEVESGGVKKTLRSPILTVTKKE